jgi:hypothetical protein
MTHDLIEQAREIGFNNQVELNGRALHVQTEVTGSEALVIRTLVMEAGTVRSSETQACPQDATDIEAVRLAVEAQHRRRVEMCKRGEVG